MARGCILALNAEHPAPHRAEVFLEMSIPPRVASRRILIPRTIDARCHVRVGTASHISYIEAARRHSRNSVFGSTVGRNESGSRAEKPPSNRLSPKERRATDAPTPAPATGHDHADRVRLMCLIESPCRPGVRRLVSAQSIALPKNEERQRRNR
jgi:hypothetical protein